MSDAVAAGQTPAAGARTAVAEPRRLIVSKRLWLWVLLGGAALWLVTAIATGLSDVTYLIPNVILLGSFLIPGSLVLFGGAIFAAWRGGAFRPVAPVIWTFLGVVALHAAWDSSYGWAIVIAEGLVGPGWQSGWPATEHWIGRPTGSELIAFNVAYDVLIAVNAVIGTVWVILAWRKYGRARAAEAS